MQSEDLHELARITAEQFGSLNRGYPLQAFLFGVVFTVLAVAVGYLLHKLQQQKYERQKIISGLHESDPETLRQLFGGEGLPPWVRFPDVARTQWINTITSGLWPHIDRAACKWAGENLEELLNSTDFWRPKWLQTRGVKLSSIFLGQVPPTVTGVKVYNPEEQQSRDEIVMEYDFSWTSRMQVKMMMKVSPEQSIPILGTLVSWISRAITIKISVKDLVARGRLRAVLRPLMGEIPVVGGIKVSFVEAPVFSYQVSVYGGSPLWVPGVEAWVNSFIKDEVLRPYIFPEGFLLRLTDMAIGLEERPEGLLTVRVVEAINVPRMDVFSAGDPYVRLFVRPKLRLSTTVKSNTTNPVWDEEFQLLVHSSQHQTLNLCMWDSDVFSADDEIGSLEIPLSSLDLTPGATNDLWLPLDPPKGKDKRRQDSGPWLPWLRHAHRQGGAGGRVGGVEAAQKLPIKRRFWGRSRHKQVVGGGGWGTWLSRRRGWRRGGGPPWSGSVRRVCRR